MEKITFMQNYLVDQIENEQNDNKRRLSCLRMFILITKALVLREHISLETFAKKV